MFGSLANLPPCFFAVECAILFGVVAVREIVSPCQNEKRGVINTFPRIMLAYGIRAVLTIQRGAGFLCSNGNSKP